MASTARHSAIGWLFIAGGAMLLFATGCLGLFQPWVLERPFWPGLNRPPGKEAADTAMDAATELLLVLTAADALLYIGLILIGVFIAAGRRCAWAAFAWGLCKVTTAVCRAWLLWHILDEQLKAIPDPLLPQYSAQAVEGPGIVGLVCILVIRSGIAAAVVVLPQFLRGRTANR